MQIASLGHTIARVRTEVAPARTRPIIPARRRGPCQLTLNPYPAVSRPRRAGFEHPPQVIKRPWGATLKDDGGLPRAGAIDIEFPAADIHGAADLREKLPILRTLCLLVSKPGDERYSNGARPNDQAGKSYGSQLRVHRVLRY